MLSSEDSVENLKGLSELKFATSFKQDATRKALSSKDLIKALNFSKIQSKISSKKHSITKESDKEKSETNSNTTNKKKEKHVVLSK